MLFQNLTEPLAQHARTRGDHPAIVHGDHRMTYAELAPLVARTAAHLAGLGVRPGDIVAVALPDGIDHVVALLAVARTGAAMLPVDWRWAEEEKERLVGHFQAKLTLIDADAPSLTRSPPVRVDASWHAAVASADAGFEGSRNADDPVMLSISSGTTGRPKGPMLTHRLLQNRFLQHWAVLGFNQHDRHLISTPLYFGGGRTFALSNIYLGATVVLLPQPWQPADLVEIVARERVTALFIVPTLIRRLLDLPDPGRPLLDGPRMVICGGSVLRPEERDVALARISPRLVNYYSSSEGGAVSILLPEHTGSAATSVGRPAFLTEVGIVDEDDRPLGVDETGRVRYRGPGVPSALYRDPEESASMFRNGWFYPGDLGHLDASGFLHLDGRAKDMIIRGGVNIYPQDIERLIASQAAVADVAVVGWPSEEYGEEVAVFVVRRGEVSEAELIALCRARLAPYKVPAGIRFVDKLPRTSVGKVLKAELAQSLTPIPRRAPRQG